MGDANQETPGRSTENADQDLAAARKAKLNAFTAEMKAGSYADADLHEILQDLEKWTVKDFEAAGAPAMIDLRKLVMKRGIYVQDHRAAGIRQAQALVDMIGASGPRYWPTASLRQFAKTTTMQTLAEDIQQRLPRSAIDPDFWLRDLDGVDTPPSSVQDDCAPGHVNAAQGSVPVSAAPESFHTESFRCFICGKEGCKWSLHPDGEKMRHLLDWRIRNNSTADQYYKQVDEMEGGRASNSSRDGSECGDECMIFGHNWRHQGAHNHGAVPKPADGKKGQASTVSDQKGKGKSETIYSQDWYYEVVSTDGDTASEPAASKGGQASKGPNQEDDSEERYEIWFYNAYPISKSAKRKDGQALNPPAAKEDTSKFRYHANEFMGILISTGSTGYSTCGLQQVIALKKLRPSVKLDTSTAGTIGISYGIGEAISCGSVALETPVGRVVFHVVTGDSPFILCLTDMNRLGCYFDIPAHMVVSPNGNAPVIMRFGHPLMTIPEMTSSTAKNAPSRRR